jgi:hypothetical protein
METAAPVKARKASRKVPIEVEQDIFSLDPSLGDIVEVSYEKKTEKLAAKWSPSANFRIFSATNYADKETFESRE